MKPKRIYLIRHGQSIGNVDKSIYREVPDSRVRLTDIGIQQAREAGNKIVAEIEEYLGPREGEFQYSFEPNIRSDSSEYSRNHLRRSVWMYGSSYYRTRQTANQIIEVLYDSKYAVKYLEDPRLREQEWGNFKDGTTVTEFERERYTFGTFCYRMSNGESGADVFDRMSTFLESVHRDFDKPYFPDTCIIVTHGLTLRFFLMRWFHWTIEEFEALKNPKNCDIVKMELQENNKYKLVTDLRRRPNALKEFKKAGENLWPKVHVLLGESGAYTP